MTANPDALRPKRPWLQFSLRAAMLATLVAGLTFGGYRIGVQHGRQLGPIVPTNISATNTYSRDYDVTDLTKTNDDAAALIDAIRDSVDEQNWDVAGGYAEMAYNSDSRTITGSHTWPGHVALVRFLGTVREFSRTGSPFDRALTDAVRNY